MTALQNLLGVAWLATFSLASAHAAAPPVPGAASGVSQLGSTVVVSWNDLGMHCMNRTHANLSVLPPYNTLFAQVIVRGDDTRLPEIVTTGVDLEYSIPGNTYSVGKTDFWTYAPALFGVTLPPDIGLTGKGLTGSFERGVTVFTAHGIPVTPWPDHDLVDEHPYQQALVIARDSQGGELARSTPVIPVSTEMNCISSGCHASESEIIEEHPNVTGFDPDARPILCAGCHASPALGTTGDPEAKYFSFRMHDQHRFMDESMSGNAECYRCHPGGNVRCLRGAMSERHALQCQNCHGTMGAMANGLEQGRVPWVQEPRCADCHLSAYAENPGTLFRNSFGHGGVMCEGCHNSTHADLPARNPEDNANTIALQGYPGTLRDCRVCHGVIPTAAGPHGFEVTSVEEDLMTGAVPLRAFPNPMRVSCTIDVPARDPAGGRLIVFDLQGRIVRMLDPFALASGRMQAVWDGMDAHGVRVRPGTYFVRWRQNQAHAAVRLTVTGP